MKNILKGAMDPRMGSNQEAVQGNMTYKKLQREYEATKALLKQLVYHNSVLKNLINKPKTRSQQPNLALKQQNFFIQIKNTQSVKEELTYIQDILLEYQGSFKKYESVRQDILNVYQNSKKITNKILAQNQEIRVKLHDFFKNTLQADYKQKYSRSPYQNLILTEYQQRMQLAQQQKSLYERECKKLKDEITRRQEIGKKLQSQNNDLKCTNKINRQNLQQCRAQLLRTKQKLDQKKRKLNDAQIRIEELQCSKQRIQQLKNQVQDQKFFFKNKYHKFQQEMKQKSNQFQKQIQFEKTQKSDLDRKIKNLKIQHQKQLLSNKDQITSKFQSEIHKLKREITSLRKSAESFDSKSNQLQKQIDLLNNKSNDLKKSLNEKEREIQKITLIKNNAQKFQSDQKQTMATELKRMKDLFQKRLADIQTQKNKLIQKKEQEVSNLQMTISNQNELLTRAGLQKQNLLENYNKQNGNQKINRSNQTKLKSMEQRIRILQNLLSQKTQNLQNERKKYQFDQQDMQRQLNSNKQSIEKLEKELKNTKSQKQSLQKQIINLKLDKQKIIEKLQNIQRQYDSNIRSKNQQYEKKLQQLRDQYQNFRRDEDQKNQKIVLMLRDYELKQKKLKLDYDQVINDLKRQIQTLKRQSRQI